MAEKEGSKQTLGTVLRQTCTHCAASKRKCSGGTPCDRCKVAGVECVYSVRKPMGRRAHQRYDTSTALPVWPSLSVSPATGLPGLAESRFLSCFLQNLAPLCAVMDDKMVRDGLLHAMASQRTRAALSSGCEPSLDVLLLGHAEAAEEAPGEEDRKGWALECALYSSITIGGLMLGCPVSDVARYVVAAQECREKLGGLKDRSAVSALILHALSHAFLGAAQAPPGANPTSSSEVEYRRSMDEAAAIDADLPDSDPHATAFMAYRKVMDCTAGMTVGILNSANPVNAVMGDQGATALGLKTQTARMARERISKGCRKTYAGAALKAHPVFVICDGHFLALRHANLTREGGAGYAHLHDYLSAELGRLVEEGRAGGAVLAALCSLLIGIKGRTARADDLLPLAELVSTQYHQFPGFARYDKCIIAYNALAVFRLLGRRDQYGSLRNIVVTRGDNSLGYTPTFDEFIPGVPICSAEVIAMSAEMVLNLGTAVIPGGGAAASAMAGFSS
eukprot:g8625.t1